MKNPTEGTVIPKNNYPPKQILTEEQLEKFLEVAKADPVWSDFFYTELTTGMRLGEICGLKWQDFEEKTGRLHIRRSVHRRKGGGVRVGETKTETGTRTILLPPSTVEILKARKKKSYSHVTDTMQKQAAVRIDHQIGKTDAPMPEEEKKQHTDQGSFQPYQPKHRKPGTGCVYRINDHLREGKYSPKGADGKRIRRNVYAKTKEECEEKLAVMIEEMKREIEQQKQRIKQQSQSEIALL